MVYNGVTFMAGMTEQLFGWVPQEAMSGIVDVPSIEVVAANAPIGIPTPPGEFPFGDPVQIPEFPNWPVTPPACNPGIPAGWPHPGEAAVPVEPIAVPGSTVSSKHIIFESSQPGSANSILLNEADIVTGTTPELSELAAANVSVGGAVEGSVAAITGESAAGAAVATMGSQIAAALSILAI